MATGSLRRRLRGSTPKNFRKRIERIRARLPVHERPQTQVILRSRNGQPGQVIDYLAMRELLIEMHHGKNLDPRELNSAMENQRKDFERLRQVRALQEQGLGYKKIAEQTDIPYGSLRTWLDGSQRPHWLSEKFIYAQYRHRVPVSLNSAAQSKDVRKQTAVGYVAGAFFGNLSAQKAKDSGRISTLQIGTRSKQFAQEIADAISILRGTIVQPHSTKHGSQTAYTVTSQDIIQQLNRLIEFGENPIRIRRLLKTPEAELSFLKALMDSNGYFRLKTPSGDSPCILLKFYRSDQRERRTIQPIGLAPLHPVRNLATLAQQLFEKHGIQTRLHIKPERILLRIRHNSWQEFKTKVGFREEKNAQRLAQHVP